MDLEKRLRAICPQLEPGSYYETSSASASYNCVAWVLRDSTRWWEPTASGQYYWPLPNTGNYSIDAYIEMFQSQGYVECSEADTEAGYEKIALYADESGEFKHVARQVPSGRWTSKLGDWEDIEHNTLSALEGGEYGKVVKFMHRRIAELELI